MAAKRKKKKSRFVGTGRVKFDSKVRKAVIYRREDGSLVANVVRKPIKR